MAHPSLRKAHSAVGDFLTTTSDMKANELMIEDWVYVSVGHPKRLEPIKIDFLSDKLQIGELKFAGELIEPIPLTEEILKANGFESHEREHTLRKRSSYDEYYYINFYVTLDGVFILDIESAKDKGIMSRVHSVIQFVHELQHALRLCGMHELADNFKIK